ncbi:MAG: DUF4392 domain-containing protein [Clostridia bacterium]|nr:DUF4392 domain-containing protein [Clostridia bacterium]
MNSIENIILQHSGRGMDKLREYLSDTFCTDAAKEILSWEKGCVLVTTGFYVAGVCETDGPPGTLFVCKALKSCGFEPIVVTDEICCGYFEEFGVSTFYVDKNADEQMFRDLLKAYAPVGLISIERCGENIKGDYANMRGISIAEYTAPIDRMFELANCPTIGIGDGGNEIGMGKLKDVISNQLALCPCKTATDHLIIATVSNWGALALGAALGYLPDEAEYMSAYEACVRHGYVDGISKEVTLTEDGFDLSVGKGLLRDLADIK